MANAKSKSERDLVALKSHDSFAVGDRLHIVGEPDERTAHLIDQGYFGWEPDDPTILATPVPATEATDAGNQQ